LPRLHELAKQAGIELPAALGKISRAGSSENGEVAPAKHDRM
jgi:hypothetical protein